jgi:hypothetical protein
VDEQQADREVWVEITARLDYNTYRGKVAVQPFKIWRAGEIIEGFGPEHICAVRWSDQ